MQVTVRRTPPSEFHSVGQLLEERGYHNLRTRKVWDPGDTYWVCTPCGTQVFEDELEHGCTVVKLIDQILTLLGKEDLIAQAV